jgi:esterase/lipase superfamily enzyme
VVRGEMSAREIEDDVPAATRTEHDYLVTRQYRVWYGTDRKPATADSDEPYFDREFSEEMRLGSCLVHVPETHRFGELASPWPRRKFRTWILRKEDDALRILEVDSLSPSGFVAGIRAELAHWQKRTALVFVHGYNVSFREAALRAAQIGFDLRIEGITAFFSWPSKGDLVPYSADEASVELAEGHFVSFIEMLSGIGELEEIHILAHSMGNRLLMRTVGDLLRLKQENKLAVPVGQIMLAAADMTAAKFKQCAASYAALAGRRVTNYCYDADKALMASRKLHDQARVGLEPPTFLHAGVETVSASALDLDLLGHGYVASAAPLLYDLTQLIHDNKAPGSRTRLRPEPRINATHWALDQ